ncbi:MAG: hypothetical protein IPQ05_04155 [Leptospiraceae bacterium]|nr:hypothetical protein [Leptospiraceae bacterium]MBL0263070.1 hypothetical protein [Leptospiraceae bacterium]MBP6740256.1 hypothetical protein [Leptospiraceae bacterium]
MNKKILLLPLFLVIFACSSKTEKPIPEKQLEGWAGNPNNPNEKPFDYFYMSHARRASQKSTDRKSGKMMEATCIEYATYHSKKNLIRRMIGYTFCCAYPNSGQLYDGSVSNESYSLNYPSETESYFQTKVNPLNALNLIAIKEGESLELLLFTEYKEKVKEAKVKDCKPLAIPDPEVPLSEWKECECTIYVHIPGGRDGIITRAKELDKD